MSANTLLLTNLNLVAPVEQVAAYPIDLVGTGASTSAVQVKWGARSLFPDPAASAGNGGCAVIDVPYTDLLDIETGDSTIEFWWYPTDLTQRQYLLGWFEPSTFAGWGHEIYFDGPNGDLELSNWNDLAHFDFGVTSPPMPFIQDAWNHVALVIEGTMVRLFVNGNYIDERSFPDRWSVSAPHASEPNPRGYCLGGDNDTYTATGYIDDFRISNIARYTGSTTYTVPAAEFTYTFTPVLENPNDANIEEFQEAQFEFNLNPSPNGPWAFQWVDAQTGQPPHNLSVDPRFLVMRDVTRAQEGWYYCTYDDGGGNSGQSELARLTVRVARASPEFNQVLIADDWGSYTEEMDAIFTAEPGLFGSNAATLRGDYTDNKLDDTYIVNEQPTLSVRAADGGGVSSTPRDGVNQSLELEDFTLSVNFRVNSVAGGERTIIDFGEE